MKTNRFVGYCSALLLVLTIAGAVQYHSWKTQGADVTLLLPGNWGFYDIAGDGPEQVTIEHYYGCIRVDFHHPR